MATKSDIINYLHNYVNDTDRVFIRSNAYESELECRIYSATDVIDLANEVGDFSSEDDFSFIDVEEALEYLSNESPEVTFLEIEV